MHWLLLGLALAEPPDPHVRVRGMTLSTPTYGREWGDDATADTLDVLQQLGVNWITYHPYARIHADGRVEANFDPAHPPEWMVRPIREAHARGMKVMVKPHLAHWGSGFSWRGAITFDDPERFFADYDPWIVAVATATREADAFVVGTELDGTVAHEAAWRDVIAHVRDVFPGPLTYASNWDRYEEVPFWDALDAVGVQAYFPVLAADTPATDDAISAGWTRILDGADAIAVRTGKPVIFTELGYDAAPTALTEPWASGSGAEALQERALRAALVAIDAHPSVRGAFLWKWFPGEVPRGDFRMSRPGMQAVIADVWAP